MRIIAKEEKGDIILSLRLAFFSAKKEDPSWKEFLLSGKEDQGEPPDSSPFGGTSKKSHLSFTSPRLVKLRGIEPARNKDGIQQILRFGIDLKNTSSNCFELQDSCF